ncbi:MAG: carboxymuconolactone decarboxylase family protein [Halopseudomonas sp.]
MSQFVSHSLDTAPDEAKPLMEGVQRRFGFIPDIYAKMANAPAVMEGYLSLVAILDKSSFNPQEQQIIQLAVSIENHCEYCVAAHSMIAKQMLNIDPNVVNALREQGKGPEAKLQALADFSQMVVRERGHVPQQAIDKFLAAGYSQAQVLEVVLGVAVKTLSNYSNHLTNPSVDDAFADDAWQAPAKPM